MTHQIGANPIADGLKASNEALNVVMMSDCGHGNPGHLPCASCSPDMVNHPAHYTAGNVECIDAIEAALGREQFIGYLRGQIMKYTWRLGLKDAAEQESGKLAWYADRLRGVLT